MKLLGLKGSQLLIVALGHICMVEILLPAAPSAQAAFLGAAVWTAASSGYFLFKNLSGRQEKLTHNN